MFSIIVVALVALDLNSIYGYTIETTECGRSKGCWFEPQDCDTNGTVDACQYAFTWTTTDNDLIIELGSSTTEMGYMGPLTFASYISVGFSNDNKMGHDAVIECVHNAEGLVKAFMSYNDQKFNYRLDTASEIMLSNTRGSVENGFFSCTTRRPLTPPESVTGENRWMSFDLARRPWIVQMAKGNADALTFALKIHWVWNGELYPWITEHKVDLTGDLQIISRAKHYEILPSIQYKLVAAHGTLTVLGWWWLASIGFFISRYFKPMWVRRKLFGTQVWYQLHRDTLIASVFLSCVGFGLVFIQTGDWKSCTYRCTGKGYAGAVHAITGLICTILAVGQPFFAWARPYLSRVVFNWLHWFFGMGSFVLATITIFISTSVGKALLRYTWNYKVDWVMGSYVVLWIVTTIAFEYVVKVYDVQGTNTRVAAIKGEIPLSTISGPTTEMANVKIKSEYIRIGILATFAVISLGQCCVLSYMFFDTSVL